MEERPPLAQHARKAGHALLSVLLGIVLPLAAILMKDLCAEEYFDPAPTWLHLVLLLLVPLHHVLLLVLPVERHAALGLDLSGGVTLGVAAVYAVVFAPLVPLALIAVIIGYGLLPLAPFGALVAGIVAQRRMYRLAPHSEPARWWSDRRLRTALGIATGILLLFAAETPRVITEHAMEEASSADPARAAEGLATLRRWGGMETLLYRSRSNEGLHLMLWPSRGRSPEEVERLYYLVTGERLDGADSDRRRWDEDQGSSVVGSFNPRLALTGSRLDGSIDGDAALGYAEWTMVFRNDDTVQAEARGQLVLPQGGMVSRARLWIDGEPREAAFGGAGEVRRAYESVVNQRRDPLLVTEVSPGVVQFQCFPVLPGREMKIALGITFPLDVTDARQARFAPPVLMARNFTLPNAMAHRAWFESKQALALAEQKSTRSSEGHFMLAFPFPQGLQGEPVQVAVERAGDVAWAKLDAETLIEQRITVQQEPAPGRVAVVIDTSRAMEGALAAVASGLEQALALPFVRVVLATDRGFRWLDAGGAREALQSLEPLGGVDNEAALVAAASWAEGGTVLWIHADQPVALGSAEALLQGFERGGLRLVHVQVAQGEHRLLEQLGSPPGLALLARSGSLELDLKRRFAAWSGAAPASRLVRTRLPASALPGQAETSEHLVRLWARDEIERLRHTQRDEAVKLAVAHRLVTPVSGAVVLETRAQYEVNGLTPPGLDGVPSVPEPQTWALLALAAMLFAHAYRQRRAGYAR